jgi:hypothetical protein
MIQPSLFNDEFQETYRISGVDKMGYSIDLSKISIEAYMEILKTQYVLPSRKILHQDIDSSFDAIHSCNIRD